MASPTEMEADGVARDELLAESRSYQVEMFEESMRRNVIVAMDTGTGKTRIAILRIRAELERSPSQIVWFLAPTVLLCYQQFYAISSQISCVQGRLIAGETDIQAWSTQAIWDAALLNIRFVVATHDVLLEALKHGFVRMESIPLLVFDEVHGCVRKSPGRRIMTEFFQRAVDEGKPHPAILGLTASPIQGKKLDGFEQLEQTMHATCITPIQYRHDLVSHTKRPLTFRHFYSLPEDSSMPESLAGTNLSALQRLHESRHLGRPWPEIGLITQQYAELIPAGDINWTWSYIKTFYRKANAIFDHLGSWPAEYYVHKVVRKVNKATKKHPPGKDEPYLMALLRQISFRRPRSPGDDKATELFLDGLSGRVQKLVEILSNHKDESPTGIVFVKEQPMAAVLSTIISLHPHLKSRFTVGHVVGMSKSQKGGYLYELLPLAPKDGRLPLLKFQDRRLNLLVATSVIEEGIDIPDCNFVVCIDELTNLKGFIQRRGRARNKDSKFHLLMGRSQRYSPSNPSPLAKSKQLALEWETLEAEMKQLYEDELRQDEQLVREKTRSSLDDGRIQALYVESTGARLVAQDARQHLSHFCDTMSSAAFVDSRPIFKLTQERMTGERFRASVQLPISLPTHLRRAMGAFLWQSPADAKADAAFQAYKALYDAGLLTDNLLPPRPSEDLLSRSVEGRSGVVHTRERYQPWPDIRRMWEALLKNSADSDMLVYRHTVKTVDDRGFEVFAAELMLPCALPNMQPFHVFWTAHWGRPWTVHISHTGSQSYGLGLDQYHDGNDHTGILLDAAFAHRWPLGDMHRLVRIVLPGERLSTKHIASRPFGPEIFANMTQPLSPDLACLVRDADGVPYFYQTFLEAKPPLNSIQKAYKGFDEAPEDAAYVAVRPWPKIAGLLYTGAKVTVQEDGEDEDEECNIAGSPALNVVSAKPYSRVLPAADCRVDDMPAAYVQFGAILPSLTQILELYLVASELLSSTRLCQLPIRDISLVATAISAPAARLPTNYEYLEFIGDSILKLLATVNCAAQNLHMPEGLLSLYKDRLVANSRLCRAALELGLDRFIVSKQWSLKNWKRYCDALAANAESSPEGDMGTISDGGGIAKKQPEHTPEMSTKMLADVVEALIGACHMDGGMAQALHCISLFLPDSKWSSLETCRDILFKAAPDKPPCPLPLGLEELLGYSFTKKSLLIEAITHASLPNDQEGACMERLEFIGDAILDHVIVQTLASVQPVLSHQKMHLLRTTLANYAFLAFVTTMLTISEPAATTVSDLQSHMPSEETLLFLKPLSSFMRHGASRDMGVAQVLFSERFSLKKDAILEQLWTGHKYPWELLLGLGANKFHSDILEAVIGAIWVDSGSMTEVERLLEKVGILPYLRRAVKEDIHLMHPKEELGTVTGSAKIRYEVTRLTRAEAASLDACKTPLFDPRNENGKRRSLNRLEKASGDDESTSTNDSSETTALNSDHEAEIRHRTIVGDTMNDIGYSCRLFFNGKDKFEVSFCHSREEAEAAVANMALTAWRQGQLGNEKKA